MSITDKITHTKYSLRSGVTDGLPKRELNGETVLFVVNAPYELQEPLCRWLLVKRAEPLPIPPAIKGDRPDADEVRAMLAGMNPVDYTVMGDSLDRPAILWSTWEAFVDWMRSTLQAELTRLEAGASC
ncbi:hypothetical protein [Paraburkholderia tagetis]|uniref:Uncharacterized protein n=1 Tax=Paraburkholderia tagetis TaxID=2913261 RepID=A0A9X1UNW2_9BURK|nr:hypothetical protein [Paraburkholderia tagetis]MCG5078910.1 hypothetical protein [Paraburkholderia tagetis]